MKNTITIFLLFILGLLIFSCNNVIDKDPNYIVMEYDYNFEYAVSYRRGKNKNLLIYERNVVSLAVDSLGNCEIEDEPIPDSLIVNQLKLYIIGNPDNPLMPISKLKAFKYSGEVLVNSNLLISPSYHPNVKYKNFNKIRNKIFIAYTEARNEFALKKFGKTIYQLFNSTNEIDRIKYNEIAKIYPIRYSVSVYKDYSY